MKARGSGRIALISSLAGLVPLPDCPAYSASKNGVVAYGLALDAALRPHGVSVSVLCPGFVKTDMSDRFSGAKPGMLSAEQAVTRMARAIERRRRLAAFPAGMAGLVRLASLLPVSVRGRALSAFSFAVEPEAG